MMSSAEEESTSEKVERIQLREEESEEYFALESEA